MAPRNSDQNYGWYVTLLLSTIFEQREGPVVRVGSCCAHALTTVTRDTTSVSPPPPRLITHAAVVAVIVPLLMVIFSPL